MLALTMPDAPSPRICFDSGFLLDTIPGWQKPMALPHDEKKAMLADPDGRAALDDAGRRRRQGRLVGHRQLAAIYVIDETFAPENKQYEGRTVADIARERGQGPVRRRCATSSSPTTS